MARSVAQLLLLSVAAVGVSIDSNRIARTRHHSTDMSSAPRRRTRVKESRFGFDSVKNAQKDKEADSGKAVKTHRCHWSGRPDRLEDYLTAEQMVDPQQYYYGKARSKNYFQHLFVEPECTNGLPKGFCWSGLRQTTHCGQDEDWAVLAPDEMDGPGVMWRSEKACLPNEGRDHPANITVDFLCLDRQEQTNLHRCVLDTNPVVGDAGITTGEPGEEEAFLKLLTTPSNPGHYSHTWDAAECSNGLPPTDVACLSSLRWGEHCTGDHDWKATADSSAQRSVSWFTSHSCTCARVAVDYFCPYREVPGWTFNRCHFRGPSTRVDSIECERAHLMKALADNDVNVINSRDAGSAVVFQQDNGTCREHVFEPEDCIAGIPEPTINCVAAFVQSGECGKDQDWAIQGADASGLPLAVRWYNNLDGGPCGDATVVVDLFCKTTV